MICTVEVKQGLCKVNGLENRIRLSHQSYIYIFYSPEMVATRKKKYKRRKTKNISENFVMISES